jgi:diaminopimelate epimerase
MKNLNFIKAQGLGNDFVIFFNQIDLGVSKKLITFISDRKIGIGCDLVAIVNESRSNYSDLDVVFFNKDGSEAEICGNALRCIGKYYFKKNEKKNITLESRAGLIDVEESNEKIIVDLGRPKLDWQEIPIKFDLITSNLGINVGHLKDGFAVNVGNPHVIFFVEKIEKNKLENDSRKLLKLNLFPNGVNINVVKLISRNEINVLTYERGVGLTQACGSGAGASAFASFKMNYCNKDIKVFMPGGNLNVEISKDEHILTIGDAAVVFEGNINLEGYI